jgi:flagellar biosynthesis/type III secretory pathway M-ring protein FliF/YscJ
MTALEELLTASVYPATLLGAFLLGVVVTFAVSIPLAFRYAKLEEERLRREEKERQEDEEEERERREREAIQSIDNACERHHNWMLAEAASIAEEEGIDPVEAFNRVYEEGYRDHLAKEARDDEEALERAAASRGLDVADFLDRYAEPRLERYDREKAEREAAAAS